MNIPLTTIYLVRHGQSESNVNFKKGIYKPEGPAGSILTVQGRREAKQLAKELKYIRFDAAFSSHLIRAKHTAEIMVKERKLIVETKQALEERRRGTLHGKAESEVRKEMKHIYGDVEKMTEEELWKWKLFDDMESAEEAATRLILVLREIAIGFSGKTVLVVAHGNIMRAFLARLGFASLKELPSGAVKNTAYIKIESDGVDFFVKETKGIMKKIEQ